MAVKGNSILDSRVFLAELSLLRTHKGKYISSSFCAKLKEISYKINEIIINKNLGAKITQSTKQQKPEKISDDMVDLCLECMEIYLQKISDTYCTTDIETDAQALRILTEISCDLCSLATYINFTLE